ncbi:MAG: GerAB/ArcD/ProY family transporter [bacterium]|nr:GerAB/ArcD/ProY family transporter [bacterium]
MDIENEKISGRQLGRIVFFDYFGISSLVLPGILAGLVGMDGFFALIAGSLAGYVLLFGVSKYLVQGEEAFGERLRKQMGNTFTAVFCLTAFAASVFGASFGLRLGGQIIYEYLGKTLPVGVMLALLCALCVYGVCGGVESRGRMYELLTVFIILPVLVLFVIAAFDVCPDHWLGITSTQPGRFLLASYIVFGTFMGTVGVPMFSESLSDGEKGVSAWKRAYLWNVLVNLALFLLLAGIFQIPTLRELKMPALTLTSLVKVPGEFLERQDALLSGVWLIALFAFIENRVFEAGWCLGQLSGRLRTRTKVRKGCFAAVGFLVWLIGSGMYFRNYFAEWLTQAYLYVIVPLLVFFIVIAGIFGTVGRDRRKKTVAICLVLCMSFFLTGCGQSQIEERAYPLALAVRPEKDGLYSFTFSFEDVNPSEQGLYHNEDTTVVAEGYPQAFYRFQSMQASVLDDSHVQALLLSEELLTDRDFLDSFYHFFVNEHHFSWNTSVYLTYEDTPKPKELKKHTGGRLGTYLHEMASSDTQQKTSHVPTLGELYKDWNNRNDALLLPVLGKRDAPEVSEYVLLYASRPIGSLTVDQARLFALRHGQLREFLFKPDPQNETVWLLRRIRLVRELSEPLARRGIWEVTLQADAFVENRAAYGEKEKQRMQQLAEKRLLLLLQEMDEQVARMGVSEPVKSHLTDVRINFID